MGCVFLAPGRNIYKIKYYVGGKQIVESAKTTDKAEALAFLAARETRAGVSGAPVGRRTLYRMSEAFAAVARDYKVNERRSAVLVSARMRLHLTPFFGDRYMTSITTALVQEFVDRRLAQGAKNATVNRELAILKRAFTLAQRANKVQARPHIEMLKERNARVGFFDRADLDAILPHLPASLRPVMLFAFWTGWRIPSEVLTLKWGQVDKKAKVIRLTPDLSKNEDGRIFPYKRIPELVTLFETLDAAAQGPYVFHDGRGQQQSRFFSKCWRDACQAANLPDRIPHDFRRTAVRNLVRSGVPEKQAMKLTGHKTRSVFDRYDIVNEQDLEAATEKLAKLAH